MNLAIIPARGGSKRIPKKNIKSFSGMPIIAYSIQAAINCKIFDKVMVSTDSEEIARIAMDYGATVPFMRSKNTSDDFATTTDVLIEVLEAYADIENTFDYLCCIYPTAPFVTSDILFTAYKLLLEERADALIPVVPFSYPPMRGLIIENSRLKMKWPENINARSQDLDSMYHDSGQFYFVRVEAFLKEKKLFCNNTVPMLLSELEVQDIDNETDWKLAELKYKMFVE
ncbi:MAG: pseudaminic acid cytidylyltransferase [Oscillospiraceae bacterium]|nr:pseudaminic acid cytidylyltransferase [Oscillospiraceae bacterium]